MNFKSDSSLREAVLESLAKGPLTTPQIHDQVCLVMGAPDSPCDLLRAAYRNRTATAMAATRKAVYELQDAGMLAMESGRARLTPTSGARS